MRLYKTAFITVLGWYAFVAAADDSAAIEWTIQQAQYTEYGPLLVMETGLDANGLPLKLKFTLRNIDHSPQKILFPKQHSLFVRYLYILNRYNNYFKPRDRPTGSPIIEIFDEFVLEPGEEIVWEFDVEELVTDFSAYQEVSGRLRISFSPLLYLDRRGDARQLSDYERLREQLIWTDTL